MTIYSSIQRCFLVIALSSLFANAVFADAQVIEGGVETTTIQSPETTEDTFKLDTGIDQKDFRYKDVQVIRAKFYYNPDAEVYFNLYKSQGQQQYPHLLGYREVEGLYRKAISESSYEDELTIWRYNGGPKPYIIRVGADIRNNGTGALSDVSVTFTFYVKAAVLKASSGSLTTSYSNLSKNAKWEKWQTRTISIPMMAPGDYKRVYSGDISMCPMLEKLKQKWPDMLKVDVTATAPQDGIKNNNTKVTSIRVLPDHYILRTLR